MISVEALELSEHVYTMLQRRLDAITDARAVALEFLDESDGTRYVYRIERGPSITAEPVDAAQPETRQVGTTAHADDRPRCSFPGCRCKRDGDSLFCADHEMDGVMVDEEVDV